MSDSQFQFRKVVTLSVGHFFHDVFSSFLAPILPLLIEKFSISYAAAGLLSLVQRLPSLSNPFVGMIAEQGWFRYMVILSPGLTALAMSMLGVVPWYGLAVLLMLLAGISSTFFHVPGPVMVRKVSGDRVGKGMSYFMVGGELARTAGPMVVLAAVTTWGVQGTIRLLPLGLLASGILFWHLKDVESAEKVSVKQMTYSQTTKDMLPFFMIVGGFIFFRAFAKVSLTLFLPTFLSHQGRSLWYAGGALSLVQLAGAIGTFFAGSLSDRFGRKHVLWILAVSTPVFMLAFLWSGGFIRFIFLVGVGLAIFSSGPVTLALVQDQKTDYPAFLNGIYMTLNFSLSSLMALLVGGMSDWMGLEKTYLICALLSCLAIPFINRLQH